MFKEKLLTSKHHIVEQFAKRNRVLFVEANYSLPKLILGLIKKKWPISFWGKMQKVNKNITVATPPPRLLFRNKFNFIADLNQLILLVFIKKTISRLGFQKPIFWTWHYQSHRLIKGLNEKLAIYAPCDEWTKFPFPWSNSKLIWDNEKKLANSVDIIITPSIELAKKFKPINNSTFHVSQGVDVNLFQKRQQIPTDISCFKKPIVGFVGNINPEWIDFKLIKHLSSSLPHISFVMIGPIDSNLSNRFNENYRAFRCVFDSSKNVHFLGLKRKEDLPGYLRAMDVCIIPYQLKRNSITPLKLLEYLASGKSVVSVNLPEVRPFKNIVRIVEDHNEFRDAIERALENETDDQILKRLETAHNHSWENKIEEMSVVIKSKMQDKKG